MCRQSGRSRGKGREGREDAIRTGNRESFLLVFIEQARQSKVGDLELKRVREGRGEYNVADNAQWGSMFMHPPTLRLKCKPKRVGKMSQRCAALCGGDTFNATDRELAAFTVDEKVQRLQVSVQNRLQRGGGVAVGRALKETGEEGSRKKERFV